MHSKKSAKKSIHQRQFIAQEAARIIATEGQRNYGTAKRKAADRLGMKCSRQQLPSNLEIERELRTYQALYGGNQHTQIQQQLRSSALDAMNYFAAFHPRLVGPVLEGTADQHTRITLHVFSDDPDAVPRFLYDQSIAFEQESRRIRWHDNGFRSLDIVCLQWSEQQIELCLFGTLDQRQAPPCPVAGRPQRRAGAVEVEYLLTEPVMSSGGLADESFMH